MTVRVCGLRFISADEWFNDETGVERLAFVIGWGPTLDAALADAAAVSDGDTCRTDKPPLEQFITPMADEIRDEWLCDREPYRYENTIYIKRLGQPWQPLPGYENL